MRRSLRRWPRFSSRRFRPRFSAPWSYRNLPPARAHANRFESLSPRFCGRLSAAAECSHRQRGRFVRVADSWRSSLRAKVGQRFRQTRHSRTTPCWLRPAANTVSRWSRAMETSIASSRPSAGGDTRGRGQGLLRPRVRPDPHFNAEEIRCSEDLPVALRNSCQVVGFCRSTTREIAVDWR
jgi:hypothetical protein